MYQKISVLIIEDEKSICDFIGKTLDSHEYKVTVANNGKDGLALITSSLPDLVLLDLGLPDMDGMDIIRKTREWSSLPIIVISARTQEKEKVQALDAGADDYITKPFAAEELVARMETVLRRTGRGGRELCAYDVVLDTVNHTARRNGEPVELRRLEYDLLELLMRNRGAALYRDVMYERVWGGIPDTESLRTVDTHIARLRKKLGWTDKIETVYKIGYRLKKED